MIASVVLAALLTSLSMGVSASVLTGTLGRWLDAEAAPQLAETLSRHPKFSGETLQIVTLRDGRPVEAVSRLHQAVQAELTQQLLKYPGVKLAWQEPADACGVPRTLNYLLGIEIEQAGSATHSLNIGMVDVAESVWVSGVSLSWRGRLTAAEKVALRTPAAGEPKGTVDSPLPAAAVTQIAEVLSGSVRCSLPEGITGAVYIEPAQMAELNRLRSQLGRNLTLAATAAVTTERQEAEWLMRVSARNVGNRTQEVLLTLDDEAGTTSQQIASVFVVGLEQPPEPPGALRMESMVALAPLLSPMQLHHDANGGICRSSRGHEDCVEISFELTRDAYLFVLSTNDQALKATSCSSTARRAEAGERRFRLRVPRDAHVGTANAGLYAIAVSDRSAARALANHIGNAPGACARQPGRDLGKWLRQLDTLLGAYPDSYEWRAMHLAAGADGVVAI